MQKHLTTNIWNKNSTANLDSSPIDEGFFLDKLYAYGMHTFCGRIISKLEAPCNCYSFLY